LTREISEGAQLSKFASPSLAQPNCSPLAHADPRAHGPVPHKLPIETGKARNLPPLCARTGSRPAIFDRSIGAIKVSANFASDLWIDAVNEFG
jgi:hypothetical protein